MVRVPRVGLGYRRQRAGIGRFEEVRLRNRVERSHPPDNAKGGRERDISYCSVNGISPTTTGQGRFAWTHEGAYGTTAKRPWNYVCELRPRETSTSSRGLDPRETGKSSNSMKQLDS